MAKSPTKKRFTGRKGGQRQNRNALRHGLRAGQLPKDAKHVEFQCNILRRQLEDSVLAERGRVTINDAAAIQTALKWERHSALCMRWLRLKGEELKPEQFLRFSESIAKASSERDKAIRTLALDAKPLAPWLALDVSKENSADDE